MNYFELYELPIRFNPDQDQIKKKFYALSKQYHPDFYIGQAPEKQEEALERATLNNKAYQVLRNERQRLRYLLDLKGLLPEGEHYSLDPAFLMEMMEINEALMEQEFDPDPAKLAGISQEIATLEQDLTLTMQELTHAFDLAADTENNLSGDASPDPQSQSLLAAIKDKYYRYQYIQRIRERLSGLASSSY